MFSPKYIITTLLLAGIAGFAIYSIATAEECDRDMCAQSYSALENLRKENW